MQTYIRNTLNKIDNSSEYFISITKFYFAGCNDLNE